VECLEFKPQVPQEKKKKRKKGEEEEEERTKFKSHPAAAMHEE
jgi:hypothetical protein